MRLTKTVCDRAAGRDCDYSLWDEDVPGFGLRVSPLGARTFILRYRAGGRQHRYAIGRYGELTVAQAKAAAKQLRARIALGANPARERRDARDVATVRELAEVYLERHLCHRKPRTRADTRYMLRRRVLPWWGSVRVTELTREEVAAAHRRMKHTPVTANRMLALISAMYGKAEQWGMIPDSHPNPGRLIERYSEPARDRYLSDEELVRVGEALRVWTRVSRRNAQSADALRLILFTGCRHREVLHLTWEEVDWKRAAILLKDSKSGPRTVALTPPAIGVLRRVRGRIRFGPWVFPSPRAAGKPMGSVQGAWEAVREKAGVPDVRIHDLRHTHASVAVSTGLSLEVIGSLLGHRKASTTERYAHLADDPVRRAAERVQGRISALLDGQEPGAVVPLRGSDRSINPDQGTGTGV